jgi:hypothetical protein
MQCFTKIGEIISLANDFLRSSFGAGINGWFGWLNGKLGTGSGHRVTLNSHDIERAEDSDRQVGERRFLAALIFDHHPLVGYFCPSPRKGKSLTVDKIVKQYREEAGITQSVQAQREGSCDKRQPRLSESGSVSVIICSLSKSLNFGANTSNFRRRSNH